MNKKHVLPIIAAGLLLLPVLYVLSYFAIVVPGGEFDVTLMNGNKIVAVRPSASVRIGGDWSRTFFWPVEQVDRKLRPKAWGA